MTTEEADAKLHAAGAAKNKAREKAYRQLAAAEKRCDAALVAAGLAYERVVRETADAYGELEVGA